MKAFALMVSTSWLVACGNDDGTSRDATVETTVNASPTVHITAPLDLSVVDLGATVSLAGNATDDHDAPATLAFRWVSSITGPLAPAAVTGSEWSTLEFTFTTAGHHILTLEATDSEGAVGRATVTLVVNGPPTAPVVRIDPASPTTDDALVATLVTPASDSDTASEALVYTWQWFRDDVPVGLGGPRVEPALTARGERWVVRVSASDGHLQGEAGVASVTIGDSAPTCASAVLLPSTGDTTTAFTCRCNGRSDPDDDDTRKDRCVFRAGDVVLATVDANPSGVCALDPDLTSRGQTLHCDFIASDGESDAAPVASAAVVLGDAPPPPPAGATLTPDHGTVLTTFTCAPSAPVVDPDGDTVTYAVSWVVNGFENPGTTTTSVVAKALDADPAGTAPRHGDSLRCRVRAQAGSGVSSPRESVAVVLGDAPPSGGLVTLLPSVATEATTLGCAVTGAEDPDGDSITWTFSWAIDGQGLPGASGPALDGTTFDKGDEVTCTATPHAGDLAGDAVGSKNSVVIGNSLPTLAKAVLTPAETSRAGAFTCAAEGYHDLDPADQVPTVRYAWFEGTPANPAAIPNADGNVLSAASLSPGTTVFCRATPVNGTDLGASVDSATGTVVNHKPTLDAVHIEPAQAVASTVLTCVPSGFEDIDGDPPSYRYAWRRGVEIIAGATGPTLGGAFVKGDAIYCAVTPSDGWSNGAAVLSNGVVIGNELPSVAAVTLAPSFGSACDTYRCEPDTVSDPDSADTVLLSYRWTRNGEPLVGGRLATFDGANVLTPDDVLQCFVTPSDGSLGPDLQPIAGVEVASNEVAIYNTPPRVGGVSVTPAAPVRGMVVSCVATGFVDDECDPPPAYLYRWYDGADVIAGEVGPTLATGDLVPGAQLSCQVVPFDGWVYGTPKLSKAVTLVADACYGVDCSALDTPCADARCVDGTCVAPTTTCRFVGKGHVVWAPFGIAPAPLRHGIGGALGPAGPVGIAAWAVGHRAVFGFHAVRLP